MYYNLLFITQVVHEILFSNVGRRNYRALFATIMLIIISDDWRSSAEGIDRKCAMRNVADDASTLFLVSDRCSNEYTRTYGKLHR